MNPGTHYDVVIVGAGVAGALIAKRLSHAGKKVLILEAGAPLPPNRFRFMQRFFAAQTKAVEAPYTPALWTNDTFTSNDDIEDVAGLRPQYLVDPGTLAAPRPNVMTLGLGSWNNPYLSYLDQQGPLAFGSTYERLAGGTMNHWLGTSMRHVPNDFQASSQYGNHELVDWPIKYHDLENYYGQAEWELGVSADVAAQSYLGITFGSPVDPATGLTENAPAGYQYPLPEIPQSVVDQAVDKAVASVAPVDGIALTVTTTPATRVSGPLDTNSGTYTAPLSQLSRPQCEGNTNCIPICPIQAKFDPTVTLRDAIGFGAELRGNSVATKVLVGADGRISGIAYQPYPPNGPLPTPLPALQTVTADVYVIAAHAIETPRLLLMSANQNGMVSNGVANSSGLVGQNLMDHPLYLAWALSSLDEDGVYGYRGPLATGGIESLRDGAFRSNRAAFRIEIGNDGWSFSENDPYTTPVDFVMGTNNGGLNGAGSQLYGSALAAKLNQVLTRQFRLGFLVEQTPDPECAVTLSTLTDGLGLPRPKIVYKLSPYTMLGFVTARYTATAVFNAMGATEYSLSQAALAGMFYSGNPTVFKVSYTGDPLGDPSNPLTYVAEENVPATPGVKTEYLQFWGSGHIVGTYRMGTAKENSVVNADQRSWDHDNLYLVGSGVFPTIATANPSLTISALALKAADAILQQLG